MVERKIETFVYKDLGFPIQLIDVPMKKILGEWVLDVDLNIFQLEMLKIILHKSTSLQAGELRFIRKYFEMTTTAFGEVFGVTHAAVLKWEKGELPPPITDVYIRMFVLDRLKAKNEEIGKLYHEVSIADLAKAKKKPAVAKPLTWRPKRLKSVA